MIRHNLTWSIIAIAVSGTASLSSAEPATQAPTQRLVKNVDLERGTSDVSSWLNYGGSYDNSRFSPLAEINDKNVNSLEKVWQFSKDIPGPMETSPVVFNGVMYLTMSSNNVFALDAKTGFELWHYKYENAAAALTCCGAISRGVAFSGNNLYMATLDGRMVAIDQFTGKEVWRTQLNLNKDGTTDIGASFTSAPLIVKNLAIIGSAGGEFKSPGFIAAVDTTTGKLVWKIYTVPTSADSPGVNTWYKDSWKYGGAPAWATGTYDVKTGLLYWTTGNPGLDWASAHRAGDNLYSDSVLALDPATGEMKWYFQFTPHDIWDFDATNGIVVTDLKIGGKDRRVLLQPNRNGFVYVLDAKTGQFISGTQYTDRLNWATGLTPEGRPIVAPGFEQNNHGKTMYPGSFGGNNGAFTWAYNPLMRFMYIPSMESGVVLKETELKDDEEMPCEQGPKACLGGDVADFGGKHLDPNDPNPPYGTVTAFEPEIGQIRWQYRDKYPMMGGALATAGNLVFTGNLSGTFIALNGFNGKPVWTFKTNAAVRSQPITYKIDGRQYVAIASGGGGIVQFLAGQPSDGIDLLNSHVTVFALPEKK